MTVESSHQKSHVRQAESVRLRRRQLLDPAHQVVAEQADGAADERRQFLELRRVVA